MTGPGQCRRWLTEPGQAIHDPHYSRWVGAPNPTKLHRLKENVGAADVALTAEDLRSIEEALSKVTVQGARYPARMQERVGR